VPPSKFKAPFKPSTQLGTPCVELGQAGREGSKIALFGQDLTGGVLKLLGATPWRVEPKYKTILGEGSKIALFGPLTQGVLKCQVSGVGSKIGNFEQF